MCQLAMRDIVYALRIGGVLPQCPLFPQPVFILFESPGPELVKIEPSLTL